MYSTKIACAASLVLALTACGSGTNSGGTNGGGTPPPAAMLAVFAGNLGGAGNLNGAGSVARFSGPVGIAIDSAGNTYVADSGNNLIRKITPAGVVTTLAGTGVPGNADGPASSATFHDPGGLAIDSAGNLYVCDSDGETVRKITPAGIVSTLAGTAGVSGSKDGTGPAASFANNYSAVPNLGIDTAGNIYVADRLNFTVRKITPAGVVTTVAGTVGVSNIKDGVGTAAEFENPSGLAIDGAGNIFVSDLGVIRKITPAGAVTTIIGTGTSIESSLTGIVIDNAGNLFVANSDAIRKITPAGVVTTLAKTTVPAGTDNGTGAAEQSYPQGIAIDGLGNLYLADGANIVLKISSTGVIARLAGEPSLSGETDGSGAAARFNTPGILAALTADSAGNIYVGDQYNQQFIRKIIPVGAVTTLVGLVTTPVGQLPAFASGQSGVDGPLGIAADSAGNVYVANTVANIINKVTPAGVISTLAGSSANADIVAKAGSADGTGAAASFNSPTGLVVDSSGNVYVFDAGNGTIRKITAAGVVTTIAGTPGVYGHTDGTGAAATFNRGFAITIDSTGNLYVLEAFDIRKITPAGVVTTFAGSYGVVGNADGTGTAATFNNPVAITADSAGNIYVADSGNNAIRKITPAGVVTHLVGTQGQNGFLAGPLPGILSAPKGVVVIGTSLYISMANGVAVVKNLP